MEWGKYQLVLLGRLAISLQMAMEKRKASMMLDQTVYPKKS